MKKSMTKITGLALAVALFAGLCAGCTSASAQDADSTNTAAPASSAAGDTNSLHAANGTLDPANPTTITFYSYSLGFPTMRPGIEHLVDEFNTTVGKEKGVVVESVEDTTFTKYQSDIAAGEQVNVIQHGFANLDASRRDLGIMAFEDIFPGDEMAEHLSHMYANATELGKLDGKTYGLAFTFSTPILYINGSLFEQAGLDPENPPQTWDEVADYAEKIYSATGVPGFGLAPDNGWTTEGLFFSNGADILNEDKTAAVFASAEGIAAMQMWQDLYQSGAHAVGTDSEVGEQFMAGALGMQLQSTSMLSGFKQAAAEGGWTLYGAELPAFEGKEAVPVNSGSALAVRSNSANESAAMWEFVKYVTGPEGYTIITSEVGYLPLNKDIVDDPAYLKPFVDENPLVRTNLNQLERLRPVTIWPAEIMVEARATFTDAVVQAVTTTGSVDTILTEAQDRINGLLG